MKKWQFWIDRGGTFTDIVAYSPTGEFITHKLLSENPKFYKDAAIHGIRHLLNLPQNAKIPAKLVSQIRMGTTVATNALLERKGADSLLICTKGFRDALSLAYQNRPNLFDCEIIKPELLYKYVVEIPERIAADGTIIQALNHAEAYELIKPYRDMGIDSVAIITMHGYKFNNHEVILGKICKELGFAQISLSHEVSPLVKYVGRGDTCVVDAYLSPILRHYVQIVAGEIDPEISLQFMQSNGGLTSAFLFQGKDAILSGPAGGIVGAVHAGESAGFDKIIGFDMGGTSTDVAYYHGEFLRTYDSMVAGVRVRAPMMQIHTLAAGGGSVCHYDGLRLRVGPMSAGANPGPACYGKGGPLTITDCNVLLGRIQPQFLGSYFGHDGKQPLNTAIVREKFQELAQKLQKSPEELAMGFLAIAVDHMANGIKKISVQQGHDLQNTAMVCFGGAGGQHACQCADEVHIDTIIIHPFSGVLSAFGIGAARVVAMREMSFGKELSQDSLDLADADLQKMAQSASQECAKQQINPDKIIKKIYIRYNGSDVPLPVDFAQYDEVVANFERAYQARFGFTMRGKTMILESLSIEVSGGAHEFTPMQNINKQAAKPQKTQAFFNDEWQDIDFYHRDDLQIGQIIQGPAIISEAIGTNIILSGWQCQLDAQNNLIMTRHLERQSHFALGTKVDPIMLEIFNNLFMAIAEQMGFSLQNTAFSVNIKERLDFSCAIFDKDGHLVANAPHMPVHLGSMGESINAIKNKFNGIYQDGDVYLVNTPYNGGTHLPDITAVTPIFLHGILQFFVASRGHHADIGGKTPGSMPPDSRHINEEGIIFDGFHVVKAGVFQEQDLLNHLQAGQYPARNPMQNIADIQAQIAANAKGKSEIFRICHHYGLQVVLAYMNFVQDNAEACVRQVIAKLQSGSFKYEMDNGDFIQVAVKTDKTTNSAIVDFTGTSPQGLHNYNAPSSVARAAVLYVFRTLVADNIPMNEGCLKPITIIIPKGSLINPEFPAAVVAGNVETSQVITDAIYGALGVMAAAGGTMNNLTFGNQQYQYYETISCGSGAGDGFHGCSGVQTHMTNSRLTDPEILELRYPVRVMEFSYRKGSGGKGKFHGGDGVIRRLKFLTPMQAIILANRRKIAPFGMQGGENGKCGMTYIEKLNGSIDLMAYSDSRMVAQNEIITIETPGGGGFGINNA